MSEKQAGAFVLAVSSLHGAGGLPAREMRRSLIETHDGRPSHEPRRKVSVWYALSHRYLRRPARSVAWAQASPLRFVKHPDTWVKNGAWEPPAIITLGAGDRRGRRTSPARLSTYRRLHHAAPPAMAPNSSRKSSSSVNAPGLPDRARPIHLTASSAARRYRHRGTPPRPEASASPRAL